MKIEMEHAARGTAKRPQWQARLVADNGEEIARLSESYNNAADAIGALHLIATEATDAYNRLVADLNELDAQQEANARAEARHAEHVAATKDGELDG